MIHCAVELLQGRIGAPACGTNNRFLENRRYSHPFDDWTGKLRQHEAYDAYFAVCVGEWCPVPLAPLFTKTREFIRHRLSSLTLPTHGFHSCPPALTSTLLPNLFSHFSMSEYAVATSNLPAAVKRQGPERRVGVGGTLTALLEKRNQGSMNATPRHPPLPPTSVVAHK